MEDEDLKAELTCPICMDLFREPRRLPCGHVYCRVCLQDMLTRKYLHTRCAERILSCPECRQRYDLTFQEAGVDVFTRDFKLFRLVELFEKKFSGRSNGGGGGGGSAQGEESQEGGGEGGAGADDQTAVKTLLSTSDSRERSPAAQAETTPAATSSSSSLPPQPSSTTTTDTPRSSVSELQQQQQHSLPPSFLHHSPADSLSDDSWIYVTPDGDTPSAARSQVRTQAHSSSLRDHHHPHHHNHSHPHPHHHHHQHHAHQRSDDSWLLPSSSAVGGGAGADVRGQASAAEVTYRTLPGGEVEPMVALSGRYDNVGPETFQRFEPDDEPTVQLVRLPPTASTTTRVSASAAAAAAAKPASRRVAVSPLSDSSSESDSSDERGDEGSEVSGSGSSHSNHRRSRLTRFFRSLVMSDSDSYDDDEPAYPTVSNTHRCGGGARSSQFPPPREFRQGREADYTTRQGREACMASARHGQEERVVRGVTASLPDPRYYEHPHSSAVPPAHRSMAAEPNLRSWEAGERGGAGAKPCDSNHNAVAEGGNGAGGGSSSRGSQRNAAAVRADITTHTDVGNSAAGAAGGVGRAIAGSRGRGVGVDVSDDSEEEYEAQTSMLRPKRKPRSRLKKFFTSLLSLSSSDEDDDDDMGVVEGSGQGGAPHLSSSSSNPPDRQ